MKHTTSKRAQAEPFITTAAAGKLLGVTPRQVRRLCKQKKIEGACEHGHRWRIPASVRVKGEDRSVARRILDAADVVGKLTECVRVNIIERIRTISDLEDECERLESIRGITQGEADHLIAIEHQIDRELKRLIGAIDIYKKAIEGDVVGALCQVVPHIRDGEGESE